MKELVFISGFDVVYVVFSSVAEASEVQTASTETLPHSEPPDTVAHGAASHDSSTDSLNTNHGTSISICVNVLSFTFGVDHPSQPESPHVSWPLMTVASPCLKLAPIS